MIYVIGSLKNGPAAAEVARALRAGGHMVFDSWIAAGPDADDHWQAYEIARGHGYTEALDGLAAKHVFEFDKQWLDYCDTGVLVMPAGRSAFSELGYMAGQKKRTFVLMDQQPARYDVMLKLYSGVVFGMDELLERLK
jgi:hypothetical protein